VCRKQGSWLQGEFVGSEIGEPWLIEMAVMGLNKNLGGNQQ
jgi:hypothetical protein